MKERPHWRRGKRTQPGSATEMATIKALLELLRGDDSAGWYEATKGAAQLTASDTALLAVCSVLRDGKHEMQRWEAAYILGRAYQSKVACRALYHSFQDAAESPLVRGVCAEQLANYESIARGQLVAAYLRGLEDPSPIVRFWCIFGLVRLRVTKARQRLQHLAATDHAECPGWSKISTEAKWALAGFDNLALQDRLWPGPFPKPDPLPNPSPTAFLRRAIALAGDKNGGPFGALVVRGKEIVAEGVNRVVLFNDPTAHAEIVAIREACRVLQTFDLTGCEIYCSCEPNPMCLGAIYWARLSRIHYAASREDAARAGFNDLHMYAEVSRPITQRAIPTHNLRRRAGRAPFDAWNKSAGKIRY